MIGQVADLKLATDFKQGTQTHPGSDPAANLNDMHVLPDG
jgi:hypothetical protein